MFYIYMYIIHIYIKHEKALLNLKIAILLSCMVSTDF